MTNLLPCICVYVYACVCTYNINKEKKDRKLYIRLLKKGNHRAGWGELFSGERKSEMDAHKTNEQTNNDNKKTHYFEKGRCT